MESPPSRIGDRERQQARDALMAAYGEGRLTLEEYEDRVAAVLDARFAHDLEPLFADLPAEHLPAPLARPSPPAVPAPPPTPAQATRGGAVGKGLGGLVAAVLVVAALVGIGAIPPDSLSVFGSAVEVVDEGEEVRVLSVFGSTEVVVPPGARVDADVIAVFGSRDCDVCGRGDGEPVRVRGLALFGSVEIVERDAG